MNKNLFAAFFFVVLFSTIPELVVAVAQDAAEKGREIAVEAKSRDTGYGDFTASVKMTLKNKQGQSSVREMDIKTFEDSKMGEKSLVIFTGPPDIKGTALLSYSYISEKDKQWVFLPSIKRVKRIASGNKTGSFVGSEFSYEDISPQQVEKYTYKYVRDEEYGGNKCFVVERFSKEVRSGYSKQVIWFDKEEYRPWKVEHFDRKDALLKTLTISGYQQYKDKFWRPNSSQMINHQTGKTTTLEFSGYQFSTGLKSRDFDKSILNRLK
ncbi:MAG: outer membrane lipoprotein-sorting protein [Nitrospinaceae bacterium]|nr:outer membrane lipoprotein-sorting protein [Nitrospinaceae bacterium]